jgi:hypothetical protein
MVDECLRTKYIKREQAEEWVDDSGRILLLGAAAHPLIVRIRLSKYFDSMTVD